MVDLPNHSIIMGGLNHWKFGPERIPIVEPRLEQFLQQKLGMSKIALFEPPVSDQDLLRNTLSNVRFRNEVKA